MTHLPVSSCGMERELSANLRQAAEKREGGFSHRLELRLFSKPTGLWNCCFSGLKWPLVLWDESLARTTPFLITCFKVNAGTREASAQNQGGLHVALGKLDGRV